MVIEEIAKQLHATKRRLILCGAREQPAQLIHQAEFAEVIGEENICENVQHALRRVYEGLEIKSVAARSQRLLDHLCPIYCSADRLSIPVFAGRDPILSSRLSGRAALLR